MTVSEDYRLDCTDCGRPIKEGEQCVVWEGRVVRFICEPCSNEEPKYKEIDPMEEEEEEEEDDI